MEAADEHMRRRTATRAAAVTAPTGAKLSARAAAHVLALLVGLCACAQTPTPRAATPTKNEIKTEGRALQVELIRAEYQSELVALRVELSNADESSLRVDPNAIFLAFDGLEYAPVPPPKRDALPPSEVAGGTVVALDLTYRLGRPLSQDAKLVFRDMRRGPSDAPDHWVEPVRLFIPAQPAVGPAAGG